MFHLIITLDIPADRRDAAAAVYQKFKPAFLESVKGARSKELLVRPEDVAVLHTFDTKAEAEGYLESALFNNDVVSALRPLLAKAPEVRIYGVV